jgi:hypothetical protein
VADPLSEMTAINYDGATFIHDLDRMELVVAMIVSTTDKGTQTSVKPINIHQGPQRQCIVSHLIYKSYRI